MLYKNFSNVFDSENIFTVDDTLTNKEPLVGYVATLYRIYTKEWCGFKS